MTTAVPISFVDAHHHFQDIENHYYPWLCDPDRPPQLEGDLSPIRRNYLPEDYHADMNSVKLIKSVHVQNGWNPADPVGETGWLQRLAAKGGFPHAIVAFADLAAPNVETVLQAHCEYPNMRGIRQILNWHADPKFRVASRAGIMDDAQWRRGFSLLARFGLSFDLQIYWPQMAAAYRLARDSPETLIILNHFGMPIDRSSLGIADWSQALTQLAQAPNVMIKLSGFGLGNPSWTNVDIVPLLLRAIDIFGVDRVMFGTNLPVDRLFSSATAILDACLCSVADFSQQERHAMLVANAERGYRI